MLRKLIAHAGRNVPYYRELFSEIGLDTQTFRGRADMDRIPPLDKETVRTHLDHFVAENSRKFSPEWFSTSGSTGTPLRLLLSADACANDAAATLFVFKQAGYPPFAKAFASRGIPGAQWECRRSAVRNCLTFNSIQMTRESAVRALRRLGSLRPRVYLGNPFSLMMLGRIARDEGMAIPPGETVVVFGDTLSEKARPVLESVFGARACIYYSVVEKSVLISECAQGVKHVIEDFAYHEFLDESGNLLEGEGKGEIVGTSFYNYAMPLIRYKTRDMAAVAAPVKDCPCGRQSRAVDRIEGRQDDYIRTPEGRFVSLVEDPLFQAKGVVGSQIVQDATDHVYVNILPGGDFEKDSLRVVEKELRVRVGEMIKIDFHIVDSLEETAGGKTRFILSKIGHTYLES